MGKNMFGGMDSEDMNAQMEEMMNTLIDVTKKTAPRVAEMYMLYVVELEKQGFSRAEAISIVANMKVGK